MGNFRIILVTLAFFGLSMNATFAQHPPLGGGLGTSDDPYQIKYVGHLVELATYVNGGNGNGTSGVFYKLVGDIDMSAYTSGLGWEPIGDYRSGNSTTAFCGNFDGENKTVRNLTLNRASQNYIGLFGFVKNGTIRNIAVENCNVVGKESTGALVGKMETTTVSNCHATGTIRGTAHSIGGLVGNSVNVSTITNSYAMCSVTGLQCTGGLVGSSFKSTISNSYAMGNVDGHQVTGGLVGLMNGSTITNCYATGNTSGHYTTGGLMGASEIDSTQSTVTRCFAIGNVNGDDMAGGLAGYNGSTAITNCYATGNVTGEATLGGLVGYTASNRAIISYCYAKGNVRGNGGNLGGLVGSNNGSTNGGASTVKNCVAANNTVIKTTPTTGTPPVNRIAGYNSPAYTTPPIPAGILQNNYALLGMIVQDNFANVPRDVPITEGANTISGVAKDMPTLKSLAFYTTAGNWLGGAWDFTTAWNICDGTTLPWLRSENINCGTTFVPVTNIINTLSTAVSGTPLTLNGIVLPYNATNRTIVWSIVHAGTTNATLTGNTLTVANMGTVTVRATITDGLGTGMPYTQDFDILANTTYVPVTSITNVPTGITVNIPIPISGTVQPSNATYQAITWYVDSAVQAINMHLTNPGNILSATGVGRAKIKAVIPNGTAMGTDYIQFFYIEVGSTFVSVGDIANLPIEVTAGTLLTLSGTVLPGNASYRTITWSIINAGSTGATINGAIFTATAAGTARVRATIENGSGIGSPFTREFSIDVIYEPVLNIINVPTTATVGTPLTLTGTVIPSGATCQVISWEIISQGTTGATINGNTFTATAPGTARVLATIVNGTAIGTSFTKNFDITVGAAYVPVREIINLPTTAVVNTPLTLTCTVVPGNATYQTVSWSITNTGTTGATLTNGNTFTATAIGTAQLTASIANGLLIGTPFTQNFDITVGLVGIADITAKRIMVYPNPTTGELRVTSYELQMDDIKIFDVMGRNVGVGFARPTNGEAVIDISHLSAGVYYLRIAGETAKVIKE